MFEPGPAEQEVIERINVILSARNRITMVDAMCAPLTGLSRQDLSLCIEALSRPVPKPLPRYCDCTGRPLKIDAEALYVAEGMVPWGSKGIVVGLGDERGDDVVSVRFEDETIVRTIHPARLNMIFQRDPSTVET